MRKGLSVPKLVLFIIILSRNFPILEDDILVKSVMLGAALSSPIGSLRWVNSQIINYQYEKKVKKK